MKSKNIDISSQSHPNTQSPQHPVTNHQIAVIGLGYVGLPLARLFATQYPVVGFDINTARIKKLNEGIDDTLEVSTDLLKSVLKNENPFCHSELAEESQKYDAVVLTVAHKEFKEIDLNKLRKPASVLYDVKGILVNIADARL